MMTINVINNNIGTTTPVWTTLAFMPTTGGIAGITDGSVAAAGNVGQIISSTILSTSGVTLSTSATTVITSIAITPGEWFVTGHVSMVISSGSVAGFTAWINTQTTGTTAPHLRSAVFLSPANLNATCAMETPVLFLNLTAASTTYNLLCGGNTAAGSKGCGTIYALRIR